MTENASNTTDFSAWLAPHRTALVVVDMQVDFALPTGALGQAGVDMSHAASALKAAERLTAAARAAGAPVVFVGLATSPETDSAVWREWRQRRGESGEAALCRKGEKGAEFAGPQPKAGEPVVWKQRYSGFYQTELDETLRALGVDTLIVCGLTTECCVDCTVRDAFHRDYFVYVPADCCAAYDDAVHSGALDSLELNCATITDSADVLSAWTEQVAAGARAHAS